MNTPQIIIGVPGFWSSRKEFIKDIAEKSSGYLYAGGILIDTLSGDKWVLELHEYDSNLLRAFEIAGQNSITDSELNSIADHTFTAYIVGEGGSTDSALAIMPAVSALLNAGGIAVKVETAGKAHSKYDWLLLTDDKSLTALYYAYVTLVADQNEAYSCGMHNLGLPDAVIAVGPSIEETLTTLEAFLLYMLLEKPNLHDGNTFSINERSSVYSLTFVQNYLYADDDLFYNPYGNWKLSRV